MTVIFVSLFRSEGLFFWLRRKLFNIKGVNHKEVVLPCVKMISKEIVIAMVDNGDNVHKSLRERVMAQASMFTARTFDQKLFDSIERNMALLRSDPFEGTHIPKRLIPQE